MIKVGANDISGLAIGANPASKAYLGATEVWSATPPGWTPGPNTLAYYSLNNTANDGSGNGYNGTWVGTAGYVPGKVNEAGNFSAPNYITCPSFPSTIGNSFTISIIAYVPAAYLTPNGQIYSLSGEDNNMSYWLYINNGGLYAKVLDSYTWQPINNPITGLVGDAWNHIVMTWTFGGTGEVYINNVLKQSWNLYSKYTNRGSPLVIGYGTYYTYYWGHYIDEVIVEKAKWSSTDVQNYYYSVFGPPPPPPPSVIVHYKLDGDATDSGVKHADGIATNVSYVTGMVNQAGSFAGAGSYITCPSFNSEIVSTNQVTISTWFYGNAYNGGDGYRVLFAQRQQGGGNYIDFDCAVDLANKVHFRTGSPGNAGLKEVVSVSNFEPGTWHYLTCIFDGSNLKIYKNGILDATASQSNPFGLQTQDLMIGREIPSLSWDDWSGNVDEFIVENKAWTAEEVLAYYNSII